MPWLCPVGFKLVAYLLPMVAGTALVMAFIPKPAVVESHDNSAFISMIGIKYARLEKEFLGAICP
jgi:hypothetical protein